MKCELWPRYFGARVVSGASRHLKACIDRPPSAARDASLREAFGIIVEHARCADDLLGDVEPPKSCYEKMMEPLG